jgi:hypothetical protein
MRPVNFTLELGEELLLAGQAEPSRPRRKSKCKLQNASRKMWGQWAERLRRITLLQRSGSSNKPLSIIHLPLAARQFRLYLHGGNRCLATPGLRAVDRRSDEAGGGVIGQVDGRAVDGELERRRDGGTWRRRDEAKNGQIKLQNIGRQLISHRCRAPCKITQEAHHDHPIE